MTRLEFLLILILVGSALGLVSARYHERRLYTLLDHAQRLELKLETERERLMIERAALIREDRVVDLAKKELGMVAIRPIVDTDYFPLDGATTVGPNVPAEPLVLPGVRPASASSSAKDSKTATKPVAKPSDRATGGQR